MKKMVLIMLLFLSLNIFANDFFDNLNKDVNNFNATIKEINKGLNDTMNVIKNTITNINDLINTTSASISFPMDISSNILKSSK